MKVICSHCDEEVDSKKANGVLTKYRHLHFCKKKECQERFIEEAGNPPEQED